MRAVETTKPRYGCFSHSCCGMISTSVINPARLLATPLPHGERNPHDIYSSGLRVFSLLKWVTMSAWYRMRPPSGGGARVHRQEPHPYGNTSTSLACLDGDRPSQQHSVSSPQRLLRAFPPNDPGSVPRHGLPAYPSPRATGFGANLGLDGNLSLFELGLRKNYGTLIAFFPPGCGSLKRVEFRGRMNNAVCKAAES